MSQNGNTKDIAIQKKDLLNQKLGNTYYSNLEFAHQSTGGEKSINFSSLIVPVQAISIEGFSNPLPSVLIGANIIENKGNVLLSSSARGQLQRFTDFYIKENNQIRLTYESEENEIFTGVINNAVRNVPSILDIKKIDLTGTLAEGADTFVIGTEFNVNSNPTQQIGDIKVYRWNGIETPKLMIRCEGNNIANDGNYIEVGTTIVFKEVGRAGGENIVVYSSNAVPTIPQAGFGQELQTIGGQIDTISNFLVDVHQLSSNIFQTVGNQVDLASFGQRVVDLQTSVSNIIQELSIVQTLQDLFASRALSTVYTNNTGKLIHVYIAVAQDGTDTRLRSAFIINGVPLETETTSRAAISEPRQSFSYPIPNGATYRLELAGNGSNRRILTWLELR